MKPFFASILTVLGICFQVGTANALSPKQYCQALEVRKPAATLVPVIAPTDHGDTCGAWLCLKGSEILNKDMSGGNMIAKYCRSGSYCVAVLDIGGGAQGVAQAAFDVAQAAFTAAQTAYMLVWGTGLCTGASAGCGQEQSYNFANAALTSTTAALTAAKAANQAAASGGAASVSWRVLNKTCD